MRGRKSTIYNVLIGFAQQKEYYVNEHRLQLSGLLSGTRCRLHASPCLQGEGREGIAVQGRITRNFGRIRRTLRLHASPCSQGEGRVGICGTTVQNNETYRRIRTTSVVRQYLCALGIRSAEPATANPSPTPPLQAREGMRSFGWYEFAGLNTAVAGCVPRQWRMR